MNLIILGAGGFAKEVACNILDISKYITEYMNIVFVDDISDTKIITVKNYNYKVIKDWNFPNGFTQFVIGVGSPKAKKILVEKALKNNLIPYKTLIHPKALVQDAKIGLGGVITAGVIITTSVTIGDYVILNLNTTVGHDAIIEDYVTCNPLTSISGNVILKEGCFIGVGATILEKKIVGSYSVVGAQSCVTKDVLDDTTVIGIPAKELKKL